MSPWTVYWITRLDSVSCALSFGAILLGCLLVLAVCLAPVCVDGELERLKPAKKPFIVACLVFLTLVAINTLTPSTKEAIAIYALPKIVNNEKVQQIPENAVDLINEQMKEWLKDLRGEKREKK